MKGWVEPCWWKRSACPLGLLSFWRALATLGQTGGSYLSGDILDLISCKSWYTQIIKLYELYKYNLVLWVSHKYQNNKGINRLLFQLWNETFIIKYWKIAMQITLSPVWGFVRVNVKPEWIWCWERGGAGMQNSYSEFSPCPPVCPEATLPAFKGGIGRSGGKDYLSVCNGENQNFG